MRNLHLTHIKRIEYKRGRVDVLVISVGSLCAFELLPSLKIGKTVLEFQQGSLNYRAEVYIMRVDFKFDGAELEVTEDLAGLEEAWKVR